MCNTLFRTLCSSLRITLCSTVCSTLCSTVCNSQCSAVCATVCNTIYSIVCSTFCSIVCSTAFSTVCSTVFIILCSKMCSTVCNTVCITVHYEMHNCTGLCRFPPVLPMTPRRSQEKSGAPSPSKQPACSGMPTAKSVKFSGNSVYRTVEKTRVSVKALKGLSKGKHERRVH